MSLKKFEKIRQYEEYAQNAILLCVTLNMVRRAMPLIENDGIKFSSQHNLGKFDNVNLPVAHSIS